LYIGLTIVLLLAAALRFYGLNWDGGLGAHPDERYVVGVAENVRWSDGLNPLDIAPGFAYGHLPPYLLALLVGLVPRVDPLLVGRALSALFDLGTVALTFALARRLYGESAGLLASAFVALMVVHVQQAHFFTVDTPLAFFALGTLLFSVRLACCGRSLDAWLAGAWAGLALGTKFSAALLVLPLGAAHALLPRGSAVRRRRGVQSGMGLLVAFALTNPFALIQFPAFWRNVAEQAALARGVLDVPYTRQFHGTCPYLYPVIQQLRWGMGWPLGLVAFGGLAYAIWQAVRKPPRRAEWVVLTWTVPYFAFVGALYVKYPRYLLPLTPLLAVYAARMLFALAREKPVRRLGRSLQAKGVFADRELPACHGCLPSLQKGHSDGAQPLQKGHSDGAQPLQKGHSDGAQPSHGWSSFPTYAILIYSFLHCLAFVSLYRQPHPWLTASRWFYDHVPQGTLVAVEQWDHPLPLDGTGYDVRELPIFDEDTPGKWAAMEETLAQADYVVIASRRAYATLARWPERYPRTSHYYRLLFEGKLGFEPVACFERYPRLGPLALVDDPTARLGFSLPAPCQPELPIGLVLGRLDESFVVYDHPLVVILRRAGTGF